MKKAARSLPDTNILIRYLVKDNPALFTKAKGFFDKVKNGTEKAIILESVIAECIYVLTKIYKVPRDRASDSLVNLLHYKGVINEDRKELVLALTIFSDTGLDIVDSILCAKASGSDANLFSFDEELNKVAKGL